MQFIYDDVSKGTEGCCKRRSARDEHCFERFGRDEQDARWLLEKALLAARRYIAMPADDRDLQLLAQAFEARPLIVDQCLQGTDVKHAAGDGFIAQQVREDWEKRSLGFTRRRGRGDDHVAIRIDQRGNRALLRIAQLGPAFLPDPSADAFVEQVETSGISRAGSWRVHRHRRWVKRERWTRCRRHRARWSTHRSV